MHVQTRLWVSRSSNPEIPSPKCQFRCVSRQSYQSRCVSRWSCESQDLQIQRFPVISVSPDACPDEAVSLEIFKSVDSQRQVLVLMCIQMTKSKLWVLRFTQHSNIIWNLFNVILMKTVVSRLKFVLFTQSELMKSLSSVLRFLGIEIFVRMDMPLPHRH